MNDTGVLGTVINSNNAIDYLVRCTEFVQGKALVPIMTSDTTPSGTCSASSVARPAYHAFDGIINSDHGWTSANGTTNAYLQYEFPNEVVIKRMVIDLSPNNSASYFRTFIGNLLVGNDTTNLSQISTNFQVVYGSGYKLNLSLSSNNISGKYVRIQTTQHNVTYGSGYSCLMGVQFYDEGFTENSTAMTLIGQNNYAANTLLSDETWLDAICNSTYFERVLNVKVPTMTSATAPSGVVSASSQVSGREAWHAFDRMSNVWQATATANQWIRYQFTSSTKLNFVTILGTSNANRAPKDYKIEGSADGNAWTDLTGTLNGFDGVTANATAKHTVLNNTSYSYYRISATTSWGGNTEINEIQFYCRTDV